MKFVKNNLLLIFILLLIIIAVVVTSLLPPQLLRIIMDNYLIKHNTNGLLHMALLYITVLIFIGLFDFLKNLCLTVLGQKISTEIRKSMTYKLERIDANYFSNNDSGNIVSSFTNDVDAINTLFSSGIVSMVIDCFKIIGIIISIWMFSKYLGLITLILVPVVFFITKAFRKIMLTAQIENRKLVSKVNNHIAETMKNIMMIKGFSKEKFMEDKYCHYLKSNYETLEKVNYLDSIYSPVIMFLKSLCICAIVILCCKDVNVSGMSIGMVAASIELISNLFSPIESLGMELQSIQTSMSGVYRVKEFFAAKEDVIKNPQYTFKTIMGTNNSMVLNYHHVTFSYDGNEKVLNDVNLIINALDKVTFMGRTGAGKSTLFKLTMGMLRPLSGSITINGADTYLIPNEEKKKIFGYVEQSFSFIQGTVEEQISLKDPEITHEDVIKAMCFVSLHNYVLSLPKGYDTNIEDDTLFSQGQKQLLAIARAIVNNPPILLLDEITANLDSITEQQILSVLQKASQERTILSISHRLSSIMKNNKIIDLEQLNS